MRKKIFQQFGIGFVAALLTGGALLYALVATVPVWAQSGSLDVGLDAAAKTGLVNTDIRLIIASIIRAALGFLGTLALLVVLYAGFRWMTAAGNDEQIASSKKILINGVIGLAIIISAFAITNFVISQLNDAINNAGGNNNGGGGGGGVLPANVLYVSSLPPSGQACIRNVHPTIVFSLDVDIATVSGNIEIQNDGGQAVAGAWAYLGNDKTTISFTPSGSCAPDAGNDCLLPQTQYHLVFVNPSNVKSLNGALTLNCLIKAGCGTVDFTTGTGVDRLPPTISFVSPNPGDSLQAGAVIPVTMHFTDDNGVQQVRLASGGQTIGSESFANCQKTGDVTIAWPTQNLLPGQFTLDATAIDFSAQTGNATTNLTLKPAACFNGVLDNGETQIDCGGVCGACGGSSCTRNSDCASGFCYIANGQNTGICVNKMSIQAYSPTSGAPGTIVSVDGLYFGTTPGHVYFPARANPDPAQLGDWVEAQLAQCGSPLKSWTNYEILVQVPNGAVSGPIMVITAPVNVGGNQQTFTDVTNDQDWGPVLSDFQVTNQIRPGLCEVTPNSGVAGDTVALTGKNFGLFDNGQDSVLFADQKSQVAPQNWNDTVISTLVPNTAPLGLVSVKVVNNGVESNGVRFSVLNGANASAPVVNGVSPASGGAGEYVTITGSHFGTKQGKVWFKLNGQGNASIGETNFPVLCQNALWSDTHILVKVPMGLKGAVGDYSVQVVTGDTAPLVSVVNTVSHFALQNVEPRPGICAISPSSGPVPFPPGQKITITGEYFGNNPDVYFWKNGASANAIAGRTPANKQDSFNVTATTITARPPADTQTGPVVVYRTEDTTMSNELPFTVGDCTKSAPVPNTCGQVGYTCCVNGGQSGMCVPPGQLCQGQTMSAAYVWRFSTRDIPPVPHVVERCNADSDAGKNIPSPSPNVLWDSNANGDSHNVCRGALVSVEFTTLINQTTVDNTSVVVNKCTGVTGNNCTNPTPVTLDNSSFALQTAQGGNGQDRSYLSILPAASWENNTWYQVVLRKRIATPLNVPLYADKPCDDANGAYCFVFRTDQRACKLNAVLVTPTTYITHFLESPVQHHSSEGNFPVIYNSSGISDQHCVLMDTRGYSWDWDTTNHTYATIFNKVVGASSQKVSALGNTVGVNMPGDSVGIQATASTNTPQGIRSVTGESPLTIDLSNPKVVKYWPNCLQACTNATVGVEFNVSMSNRNILVGNPTAVRLVQCNDENCLATVPVMAQLSVGFDPNSNNTILNIAGVGNVPSLQPNTLYQATVSLTTNDVTSPQLLWSAAFSNNFNTFSKPMTTQFSWRFKTKENSCGIDRVDVTPSNFTAQFYNDRAVYRAQPFSSPDQCSTEGQPLNAWNVAWNWTSSDVQVATVQTFSTLGKNPYCTNICLKRGSTVASTDKQMPVCGNAVVEAGEDCDTPSKANNCGLNCRRLGNANTQTCGNGIVEPQLGETCDTADAQSKIGCSATCLRQGSSQTPDPQNQNASICGNGLIGSGEDCDIGIAGAIGNAQSALYCSNMCLHVGTTVSSKWCFDHAADFGGFTQKEYQDVCATSVSMCGDGVTSPDEDANCDLGGGQHANFCNNNCLYNKDTNQSRKCAPNSEGCDANGQYLGSSLSYANPSVCGTGGQAGTGEDPFCETNLVSSHANITDPWTLAQGVGRGVVSGNPPSQSAAITGGTNQQTKGGVVSDSGTFTLACGYKTDADCQAVFGSSDYGVGTDTCCYLRPKLVSTYPSSTVPIQKDVCPNTSIQAYFNGLIDPSTVNGSVVVAFGTSANAPGTQKQLVHTTHVNTPMPGIPAVNAANVAVQGDKVYVLSATNGGEFQVYTINGNSLTFTSKLTAAQVPALANGFGITVSGRYAYVLQYNGGNVQIIDIDNPAAPVARGKFQDATLASSATVAVDGNTLYATSWSNNKLFIINATDRNAPVLASTVANGQNGALLAGAMAVTAEGGYAYVAGWGGHFQIIDATNPAAPVVRGSLFNGQNVGGKVASIGTGRALAKRGNYIYLASYNSNLIQVIDVTDKAIPKPVVQLPSSPTASFVNPVAMTMVGNYLFVVGQGAPYAIAMFDITNPASPVPVTSLSTVNDSSGLTPFNTPNGVAAAGTYAYIASNAVTGGVDVVDFHTYANPDTICINDVTQLIASANSHPWYQVWWQKVIAFVKGVFSGNATAKQNFVPSDWCAGQVQGYVEVINDTSSTSHITYHLNKPLAFDTTYAVILSSTIKDVRGVQLGTQNNGKLFNFQFNTAGQLCELKSVLVAPSGVNFSRTGATTTLEALALTAAGVKLQPIPSYYNWEYAWGPTTNDSIAVSNVTTSRNLISAKNRNGEVDVYASAVMKSNTISSATGTVATGKSHAIVFLCENPWPAKQVTVSAGNNQTQVVYPFPYADKAGNTSGFAAPQNTFDGSAIPASPLPANIVGDGYFNFSTYYCADTGSFGFADDLPLLRPAVQVQNNIVSANDSLKRFIFTTDKNNDAVGIQVFANPKHLSPEEWYSADKAQGGRGFVGNVRTLTVDGYRAVRDDNNVYVDAVNYATNQQTVYSNIYLFSISADAQPETKQVFDQLLKNLRFNINLTNYGYCGGAIDKPDFVNRCTSDFDCTAGQICANQVDKLKRNYIRFSQLQTIDKKLSSYALSHANAFPSMQEGSFLTGQAISTWSSAWSALGNTVGAALPVDPINQLGKAGTCASNTAMFCTSDAQCGNKPAPNNSTPDTCVLHEAETGWSVADRRFSFACSVESYAYRYRYSPTNGFSLRARYEDIGVPIVNFNSFIDGFSYSSHNNTSRIVLTSVSPGICDQANEITSISQGICGDNVVNVNLGEECDPPGAKVYNASACANDPVNGVVLVQTCGDGPNGAPACRLATPSTIQCSDYLRPKCGNGKMDPGEQCDEGALNGRYNHCSLTCTPPVSAQNGGAGFCGDGVLTPKYETCDPSATLTNGKIGWCKRGAGYGLACSNQADCNSEFADACKPFTDTHIRYALTKSNSCNFDCQSTGPYCGDGVVQSEYGEECDGNAQCSVSGVSGTRSCNAQCHYTDSAAVLWARFDDMYFASNINRYYMNNAGSQPLGMMVSPVAPVFVFSGGVRDAALGFNSDNQYVQVYDSPALMPTTTLSVEAWVRPSDYNSPWMRVLEKGGWTKGGGYGLQFFDNTGRISFAVFRPGVNTHLRIDSNQQVPLPVGTWTHVVGTYNFNKATNQQSMELYINGQLDQNAVLVKHENDVDTPQSGHTIVDPAGWLVASTEPLYIGMASAQMNYFHGLLDEIKVYGRTLSANEVKDHYTNGPWSCAVGASNPVVSVAAGCGDSKVDGGEACDNGAANGRVCTPGYNQNCSYCAGDCKNIITVNAGQYCGNGIVEGPEFCDFENATVYAKVRDVATVMTDYPGEQPTLAAHGGYVAKACENEFVESDTFKKGSKYCANTCSSILVRETRSPSCVICGIDNTSGAVVSGNLLNVLEADQVHALYADNTVARGTRGGSINLYTSGVAEKFPSIQNPYSVSSIKTVQGDANVNPSDSVASAQYTLKYYPDPINGPAAGNAKIGNNALCSANPGNRYMMALNVDTPRAFAFDVKSNPDSWDYDLLLSPIISATGLKMLQNGQTVDYRPFGLLSGTPHNIRVVVRWIKSGNFNAGFVRPRVQNGNVVGTESIEDTQVSLSPQYGPDYFGKLPSDTNWQGMWYHGYNTTPGLLFAESYTLDTSRIAAGTTYKFYVRTSDPNSGIKPYASSAKLRVDVYFPETSGAMFYNLYSQPSQSFVLDLADVGNQAAPYWHVLDIASANDVPSVTDRVVKVQKFDPVKQQMVTYPNGKVITDLTQL